MIHCSQRKSLEHEFIEVSCEQTNHFELKWSHDELFSVLVYSHNESFTSESFSDVLYHSKGNHSPMTHLPERTADAVGCAGPAGCSGGWACRWAGLQE